MNQRLFSFVALVAFLFTTAALYAKGGKEPGGKVKTEKPNAARSFLDANSKYLDGYGGGGKGLAILAPQTRGLSMDDKSENYYPSLVQGAFVTSFSKYSGLSVLDRLNLEKVLRETESGIYRDENAFVQLGEIANVDYVMTGTLTKTASGRFVLQIQVAEAATGAATKASASVPCTAAELQNLSAINKTSLDIFGQLGISITDAARNELLGIGSEESLEAQTALARGITAQRGGSTAKTTVETLFYYSEAQSLDPSLREAAERLSAVQTAVQAVQRLKEVEKPAILQQSAAAKTGNIGADARNEVERYRAEQAYEEARRKAQAEYDAAVAEQRRQRREDLQAKQRELIGLLAAAEYFLAGHPPFEMRYDPSLEQGTLDREKGTIDLRFYCATIPASSGMDVLKTILDNLASIEKQMDEAGAQKQTWTHTWKDAKFTISFSLLDEKDAPIANEEETLQNGLLNGDVLRPMTAITQVTFRGVDVYKITDTLRIRINRINGVPVAEGSPSLIKISTARFSDSSYNINGYNRQGWDRGGYGPDGFNKSGYDREGYDRSGYNKSGYDRQGKDRNGLTLEQNVAAGVHAWFENNAKRGVGATDEVVVVPLPFTIGAFPREIKAGVGLGFELSVEFGGWGIWGNVGFAGGFGWLSGFFSAGGSLHLFKNFSLDLGLGVWSSSYDFNEPKIDYSNGKISAGGGGGKTLTFENTDAFILVPGITYYTNVEILEEHPFVVTGRVMYDPVNNVFAVKIGLGLWSATGSSSGQRRSRKWQ
jgi:TolB-like protein